MKYVLKIAGTRHSWAGKPPVTSSDDTREEAFVRLVEYVKRNWQSEMNIEADTLPPENAEEMVEAYFAHVLERYQIVEVPESEPRAPGSELPEEKTEMVDQLERRIRGSFAGPKAPLEIMIAGAGTFWIAVNPGVLRKLCVMAKESPRGAASHGPVIVEFEEVT